MVYKEQLKADSRFSMDLFFVKVLHFHNFAVTQLHLNSWRILVAFCFLCFNKNVELSVHSSPNYTNWVPRRTKNSNSSAWKSARLSLTKYPFPWSAGKISSLSWATGYLGVLGGFRLTGIYRWTSRKMGPATARRERGFGLPSKDVLDPEGRH